MSKCISILLFTLAFASFASGQVAKRFAFGSERPANGARSVKASDVYSKERAYGFEPGTSITCRREEKGNDGNCISDKPFYFSVAVAEANYRVTVRFGDRQVATSNVVKAELRRLMLERVDTKPGEFITKSFIVNVRRPEISTGKSVPSAAADGVSMVKLKDREKTSEQWAWDEKLTLEFNGSHPAVGSITVEPINVPTVFLLGDSTVCDQPGEPYASWGQRITQFFGDKIAVANHAESGESLRSSFGAKRLDKIVSLIKPGDFLLIQYGHNDMKERGDGVGAFTTYKASLKQFTEAAKAKGAAVVLINPMNRRTFDANGKITNSHGDYPAAVRQGAKEEKVVFIDLHATSKILYEAFGPEGSGVLFKEGDGTHHNAFGADQIAKIIVQAILDQRLPLAKYIVKDWKPFDPNKPDDAKAFRVPASPAVAHDRPLGS